MIKNHFYAVCNLSSHAWKIACLFFMHVFIIIPKIHGLYVFMMAKTHNLHVGPIYKNFMSKFNLFLKYLFHSLCNVILSRVFLFCFCFWWKKQLLKATQIIFVLLKSLAQELIFFTSPKISWATSLCYSPW